MDQISTVSPTHVEEASTSQQTKKRGEGSSNKRKQNFMLRKNKTFQSELTASILTRLKVSDPTKISHIKLQSAIIPSTIPVSFRAIPKIIDELWKRMVAIGTRPFAILATERNRAIFFKLSLLLFEVKVCYAQRNCEEKIVDPPTQYTFTDMQLRQIKSFSQRLPYPLVIALEALGLFSHDDQTVMPVLLTTSPALASGAISFALTQIRNLVAFLADPQPVNDIIVQIAQALADLPLVVWEEHDNLVNLSAATVAFWGQQDLATPDEREIYLQLIASMESKKGFLLHVDLSTGNGTAVPVVRYHEPFDANEEETLYYTNAKIMTFDEQLSTALMYGYEYQGEKHSRFCGAYLECLRRGTASQAEARSALIWTGDE